LRLRKVAIRRLNIDIVDTLNSTAWSSSQNVSSSLAMNVLFAALTRIQRLLS
jgi:hypothetical protein